MELNSAHPFSLKRFRLYFLGQSLSFVGDALVPVALAFAVLDATGSASALGLVLAAGTLPTIIFVLIGGVWADRLQPVRVMLASDAARFLSQGMLGALLLSHQAKLWELIGLMAVWGTGAAFFRPASTSIVPAIVEDPTLLTSANVMIGTAQNTASVLGPALAGVLVATAGSGIAILLDSASFLVSAICLLAVYAPATGAMPPKTSMISELREGWDEFVSRRWLFAIVIWAAFYHLVGLSAYLVLGPIVAKTQLPGAASSWAAIATALGIGTIIGSVVAPHVPTGRNLLITVVPLSLFALPLFALSIPLPTSVDAFAALLGGAGLGLFGVCFSTALQREVPARVLSRVSAYDWLGSLALLPLGFALVGPIANIVGTSRVLWWAGLWIIISTIILCALPSIRGTLDKKDLPPVASFD